MSQIPEDEFVERRARQRRVRRRLVGLKSVRYFLRWDCLGLLLLLLLRWESMLFWISRSSFSITSILTG